MQTAERTATLRCEGDTIGNLMWRLEHGESPAGAGVRAMVLLIGANDLLVAAGDVRRLTTRSAPPLITMVNCTRGVHYGLLRAQPVSGPEPASHTY